MLLEEGICKHYQWTQPWPTSVNRQILLPGPTCLENVSVKVLNSTMGRLATVEIHWLKSFGKLNQPVQMTFSLVQYLCNKITLTPKPTPFMFRGQDPVSLLSPPRSLTFESGINPCPIHHPYLVIISPLHTIHLSIIALNILQLHGGPIDQYNSDLL